MAGIGGTGGLARKISLRSCCCLIWSWMLRGWEGSLAIERPPLGSGRAGRYRQALPLRFHGEGDPVGAAQGLMMRITETHHQLGVIGRAVEFREVCQHGLETLGMSALDMSAVSAHDDPWKLSSSLRRSCPGIGVSFYAAVCSAGFVRRGGPPSANIRSIIASAFWTGIMKARRPWTLRRAIRIPLPAARRCAGSVVASRTRSAGARCRSAKSIYRGVTSSVGFQVTGRHRS